jgi:flagellar biosynthesis GTPase FlhF
MKTTLILLAALVLSLPQVSVAGSVYFVACQDVGVTEPSGGVKQFQKGTVFQTPYQSPLMRGDPLISSKSIEVFYSKTFNTGLVNPELGLTFYVTSDRNPFITLQLSHTAIVNDAELLAGLCQGQDKIEFSAKGYTFVNVRTKQEEKQKQILAEKKEREERQRAEQERREYNRKKHEEEYARIQQAREAQRLEQERKLTEQRKVEEEKYMAKQKEAARRKQAILQKYNVKATVSPAELRKNPYQFEGKVILLTGVTFDRMLKKGLAVFVYKTLSVYWVRQESQVSSSEEELLVSKVPVDFNAGSADLIVKCKGTTEATNALGARITLPLVEYIAVCEQ